MPNNDDVRSLLKQAEQIREEADKLQWKEEKIDQALQKYDQAIDKFKEALDQMKPNDKPNLYAWAVAHRGQAHFQKGITAFQNAYNFEQAENYAEATFNLDQALEKAEHDFDRALKLKPDYAWAWAKQGELYRIIANQFITPNKKDLFEKAESCFNKAISLKHNYAWAIAHRAATYCNARIKREAYQKVANDLEDVSSEYPWAMAYAAVAESLMGDDREGIRKIVYSQVLDNRILKNVFRPGASHKNIHLEFVEALLDIQRPNEALKYCKLALKHASKQEVFPGLNRARILYYQALCRYQAISNSPEGVDKVKTAIEEALTALDEPESALTRLHNMHRSHIKPEIWDVWNDVHRAFMGEIFYMNSGLINMGADLGIKGQPGGDSFSHEDALKLLEKALKQFKPDPILKDRLENTDHAWDKIRESSEFKQVIENWYGNDDWPQWVFDRE